jgi:hypothetical protein
VNPSFKPSDVIDLSIFQSVNQESGNQRVTQSTNQPIKKASACGGHFRASVFKLRLLPGDGQSTQYSNLKGRGFTASASGIHRFPVVRSPAIPEGSRSSGKLGLRES